MTTHAFALLPLAPLRAAPSERSEMVSQLLFGEAVEVLEQGAGWLHVRNAADRYEGWVGSAQCQPIGLEEYAILSAWPYRASSPLTPVVTSIGRLCAPMGAPLPAPRIFRMGKIYVEREGSGAQTAGEPQQQARQLLHAPYLWGGKSLMGMDCSGLAQVAFSVCGIQLPRDASQQATQGTPVRAMDDLSPNDLCFFSNEQGKVVHVGISLGFGQIIHASGRVRIDRVDQQGILNAETGQYTHRLHSVRRLL